MASQQYSNPANDGAVMRAWQRFVDGNALQSEAIRPTVDGSWQRCLDCKVDPDKLRAPTPLTKEALEGLRRLNADILSVSAPAMANAREFLAETGTMMVLTDTKGTILSVEGDTRTLNCAETIRLIPGATWTEMICGTNAIGTALEAGRPVQIHAAEHFCEGLKRWTCSAALIRDPVDGEVLGIVDVSGLSESYNRHSLALVVTTASRIEKSLAAREMELRYHLLETAMARVSGSNDGFVLFDRRGLPIKANESAQELLTARDARLDLARPERVAALAANASHAALPRWIDPKSLQPITRHGDRIGTLLIVPAAPGGRAPPRARVADASTTAKAGFAELIGSHPLLRDAIAKASQLARSRAPMLLLGETGVGKEEFARGVHLASHVSSGPFIAVNCGGLSRDLLASELFGYAEGAFTGARRGGQIGKIEAANDGTLFLDEIGEMPLDPQPHLLRVLEEGEIHRLGESRARKVSFRLIAATHRDLRREVADGRFRMDLFYRVAVTSVEIPALRERGDDVKALAEHFLRRFCAENAVGPHRFDEAVLQRFAAYAWPGNVRELRNVIQGMVLMAADEVLCCDLLPPEFRDRGAHPGEAAMPDGAIPRLTARRIDSAERELIRDTVRITGGNLSDAARRLGIAKSTLYTKLRKYALTGAVAGLRRAAP